MIGNPNMIDEMTSTREIRQPNFNNQIPILVIDNVKLAQGPLSPPPSPKLASTLIGTATGFQFSFNQVDVPAGAGNVISSYRVYRNTLNVFNRNLIQTIPHDPTHLGAVVVTDTITSATGQNYFYWVTAVDTTGQESTPQSAQCGTVAGSTGSTPFSRTTGFAYTSTTTSITWFWDGTNGSTTITVYRADGTTTGPISGSQAITGLSASTTYNFYPYWDETTSSVQWVAGGSGTPAYAQPSAGGPTLLQQQNLRNRIPLSIGGMQGSTPSSGSGGGSGGGGGGGGGCFTGNVSVKTPSGFVPFASLPQSFQIENLTGVHWAELIVHENNNEQMIDMGDGKLVTVGHMLKQGESWIPAAEYFKDRPTEKVLGTVYNMHVVSSNDEDHHYILENGVVAHNVKSL